MIPPRLQSCFKLLRFSIGRHVSVTSFDLVLGGTFRSQANIRIVITTAMIVFTQYLGSIHS